MITITLIAALLSLFITFLVLWLNPYRLSNQVFALIMLLLTGWLGCVYRAIQIGNSENTPGKSAALEWWFRSNAIIIAFLPAAMWLMRSSIIHQHRGFLKIIRNSFPFVIASFSSALLCATPSFVSADPAGILQRGKSYYIFCLIGMSMYAACAISSFLQIKAHSGIRRVELQVFALNTGAAALLFLALNLLGNVLHNRSLNRLSILLALAVFVITAGSLLFHRVFNAKEISLRFAHRFWICVILTGGIYVVSRGTNTLIAEPFGLLLGVAILSPVAVWIDRQSRHWFDISGEMKLAELRRAAIEIAQSGPTAGELSRRLKLMLCSQFETRTALFLTDKGDLHMDDITMLPKERAAYRGLCDIGWATPESLERRRRATALDDLRGFLHENAVGIIVSVPLGSKTPSMFAALGMRTDERPYTFPEIERLQNLSELIDSIITRSKVAEQTALRARMKYLALMSHGLAHDLRTLITPVSTFLLHTKGIFKAGTNEAETHHAAQRAMATIADYVNETLSFSKQMEPQFKSENALSICKNVLGVVTAKAELRGIALKLDCHESLEIIVDRILIERMLVNIVANAIDASSAQQTVTLNVPNNRKNEIVFEVHDDGCGISPDNIMRVFDPFFSTKNIGIESRGFGLGLSIAHNIVVLHGGTLNLHSELGRRTTTIVELPMKPDSTRACSLNSI